jgi:myo-inositol 2-dehydrogenase/D-chiro-inositol 1-dehydrogenase
MTITCPGAPDRPSGTGLRVGLVGAGFIGETHLAAWKSEGIEVVVFDVDRARSSSLAETFGATVAPTIEALFVATDVVDICTPTHLHASVAIAAARAGRHVICEKPLARTLADGEAMLAEAGQAGVRLLVGQVVRFYPEYAAARQAVMAGAIGDPAVLRLTRANSRPRQPADHWFFDHARSGGIILDLMIHDLDFARWVAGEVVSVACRSAAFERPEAGVDHAVALLTHASGAISHVSSSWAYAPPTSRTAFEIAGSRGLIEQDSDRTAAVERSLQDVGASGPATSLADGALGGDPFRLELAEFARAIEADVEPRTDGADALETLRLALAADQSARSLGRTIRLEAGAGA